MTEIIFHRIKWTVWIVLFSDIVCGGVFDPHKLFMRSVQNGFDKTTVGLCATLELDVNTTSSIDLMERTTALFKVSEYDEKSWNVTMMKELKERFTKSGYTSLNFVIVIPANNSNFSSVITTPNTKENITVVADNEDLEHLVSDSVTVIDGCGTIVYTIFTPWSSLQYPYVKAAILSTMFDLSCGTCDKAPKHQLQYPLFDRKPNLILDIESSDKGSRHIAFVEPEARTFSTPIETESTTEMDPEDDSRFVIPLRVILPVEHIHNNDKDDPDGPFVKYNYYVLKSDDETYHEHLNTDPGEIVNIYKEETSPTTTDPSTQDTEAITETAITSTDDDSFSGPTWLSLTAMSSNLINSFTASSSPWHSNDLESPITTTTEPSPLYVNNAEEKYKVRKKYRFLNLPQLNFDELEIDREKVKTFITSIGDTSAATSSEEEEPNIARLIDEHYNHMIQWLDFNL